MPYDARKCLEEIQYRAAGIRSLQAGRTFAEFQSDIAFCWAVERAFEVIGEAIGRLRKVDPALAEQIPDSRSIVSFRNLLIHGYDSVDQAVVWRLIHHDLPILSEAVDRLVAGLPFPT